MFNYTKIDDTIYERNLRECSDIRNLYTSYRILKLYEMLQRKESKRKYISRIEYNKDHRKYQLSHKYVVLITIKLTNNPKM